MCENLTYIDVKSPALANIELKRNFNLESVFINSKVLQKISSISNPKLRIENIGFYIFTGVDVYIDEKSCYGDMKNIIPSEVDRDYTKKVYDLLLYILEHFDEVKCKTNICLTMFKTGNLEQSFNNRVAALISSFLRFMSGNFKLDSDIEN